MSMQYAHSGWGLHHSSDNGVYQNTSHSRDQNINNQGYQNINSGGQIGQMTAGRDVVNIINATISAPYPSLWNPIIGVGASHKSEQQFERGKCLPGARSEALRSIHDWSSSREQDHPVCWLSGAAGVGKSAIAMTVAQDCEKAGALVSSFFFFRSDPKRNNPSSLWFTIAHGLASSIPVMRSVIEERILTDPTILDASLEHQFRELILDPAPMWDWPGGLWGFVNDLACVSPVTVPNIIVIDGLDECGDEEIQLRIISIIQSAFQQVPHLPLRFLICSRPESWIREAFSDEPLFRLSKTIVLDDSLEARCDIRKYYLHHFQEIASSRKYGQVQFPDPWPSRRDLEILVERSCGQFVYAVTVIMFVTLACNHPIVQLRVILENTSPRHPGTSAYPMLDVLYHFILSAHPYREELLRVLAAILILPGSLIPSPAHIELLLDWPSGQVALTLRAMHSVLNVRSSVDEIRPYHSSFGDYLVTQSRSRDFHIDMPTQRCAIMQQWLRNLSISKIRTYSTTQLYGAETRAFFTQWDDFCASLPNPTRDLLDDLRNVDIASTYLMNQGNYDIKILRLRPWMIATPTYSHVVDNNTRKFLGRPECFHLEWPSGVSPQLDVIDWVIRRTTSRLLLSHRSKPWRPSADQMPLLTDCYCHLANGTESHDPAHLAYQEACLEIVKTEISRFKRLVTSPSPESWAEMRCIFIYMMQSSLLRHCRLDIELISLCQVFVEVLKGIPLMGPGLEQGKRNILAWIETFPDRFTEQARALKGQVLALSEITSDARQFLQEYEVLDLSIA
ncbi:hypothetical protein PM082_022679 [Marasmius tenuissimus]|nr:hypothetical protein PM082_022679 [Marasmius tenuissimus]